MKRTTLRIALIIALVASALGFIALNSAPSMMQGEDFIVREGESVRGVARRLKALNLITSENFFHYSGRLAGKIAGSGIRKGKYRIAPGSSSLRILYALMRGDVVTARVTVPEGFNLYQIAARLEASGVTGGSSVLRVQPVPRAPGSTLPPSRATCFRHLHHAGASDARDVIALMYRRTKPFSPTRFRPPSRERAFGARAPHPGLADRKGDRRGLRAREGGLGLPQPA